MSEAPAARRAAIFQDLSGVGRCALTVAVPVLSAMNVQPCPIPTAVLSAHTAFPSVVVQDLTGYMERAIEDWREKEFAFDAVLSGYLASEEQAALIGGFVDLQKKKRAPLVLVDPAMADHGRLYGGLPESMPAAMRELCGKADIILPNATEAGLLTGMTVGDKTLSERAAEALLKKLLELGCGCAMITGASLANGQTVNLCMSRGEDVFYQVAYTPLDAAFPGTGDLFASVVLGGLLRGDNAPCAMARATAFAYRAIERTMRLMTPPREGVQFEALLSQLDTIEPFRAERIRCRESTK